MIRRPPRSTLDRSSAASDVYKRQLYTLYKSLRGKGENPIGVSQIDAHGWMVLAIGFVVSFIVAYASVAWFMAWVRKRGFTPFAIYRIAVGILVLVFAAKLA